VCRVPLTYSPMLWSLVFPLGMYALASLRVSLTADFPPLSALAQAMAWVALATWLATGAGLIVTSWRSFRNFRAVRDLAG
jgi:tellurite resistance protein TehA-like permease